MPFRRDARFLFIVHERGAGDASGSTVPPRARPGGTIVTPSPRIHGISAADPVASNG